MLLIGVLCGCTTGTQDDWVREYGGTLSGDAQARVEAVSRRLIGGNRKCAVRVMVLDFDAPCAFAWDDGRIYLTRALLDMLDDHELAAAIAHEMGHLVGSSHLHAPATLMGRANSVADLEARADRIGAEMLRSAGLPSAAMSSMLQKVAASSRASDECRRALYRRIQLLNTHIDNAL